MRHILAASFAIILAGSALSLQRPAIAADNEQADQLSFHFVDESKYPEMLLDDAQRLDRAAREISTSALNDVLTSLETRLSDPGTLTQIELARLEMLTARALTDLGERAFGTASFDRAMTLYQQAIIQLREETQSPSRLEAEAGFVRAWTLSLAETNVPAQLYEIVDYAEALLNNPANASNPIELAAINREIAIVRRLIFNLTPNSLDVYFAAKADLENALRLLSISENPDDWARAHFELGRLYATRGINFNDEDAAILAIEEFNTSTMIWSEESSPFDWLRASNAIAFAERVLKDSPDNGAQQILASFDYLDKAQNPKDWLEAKWGYLFLLERDPERDGDALDLARQLVSAKFENLPLHYELAAYTHLSSAIVRIGPESFSQSDLMDVIKLLYVGWQKADAEGWTRHRADIEAHITYLMQFIAESTQSA